MEIEERFYEVNGMRLHTVEAGDKEPGKVILFLHGYPEYSYAWKEQLPFFARRGFRAVAVDQRGYYLSSKPADVAAYKITHLVEDVKELIGKLTDKTIILVAHDWGGGVAWHLAYQYPHLLQQVIILNMPHTGVMKDTLKSSAAQQLKSWYIAFFQLPWLPEAVSRAFNFRLLKRVMKRTSKPDTFSAEDIQHYEAAWRQPGALTAMINWYRANKLSGIKMTALINVPLLLIWGAKDAFLLAEMAQKSIRQCTNGKLIMIPDATHWLHHEQPERINNLILEFVQ